MTEPPKATVSAMAPHYFVGPLDAGESASVRGRFAKGCRRKGCGLPREHPVHRPASGGHELERQAATG